MFFKVQSELGELDLVKKQIEYYKVKKVSITTKVTDPNHTKQVGFFYTIKNKIRLA